MWSGGGFRTLQGFDFGSGTVNLQVRVWDITFGATYDQAFLSGPGNTGKSAMFQYLIPASSSAPGGDFVMKNFSTFCICIPEPSTAALAGLGVVALLLRRRK
jgi:hypothetical protein